MKVDLSAQVDPSWIEAMPGLESTPWFLKLSDFVREERRVAEIYPPQGQVFTALRETPLDAVKVVILGQDPYHGPGQAHGLSFSVPRGVGIPPSLRNIFKELNTDLGLPIPSEGCLLDWAHRGVLLLNTTMTVRKGSAGSHQGRGWELLTDQIIRILWEGKIPVAFVAWGRFAADTLNRAKKHPAGTDHLVIQSAHPSPLSAHQGFLGSRPFSRINQWLTSQGRQPIDWSLSRSFQGSTKG
jgi:uracil-DNA glycosylase